MGRFNSGYPALLPSLTQWFAEPNPVIVKGKSREVRQAKHPKHSRHPLGILQQRRPCAQPGSVRHRMKGDPPSNSSLTGLASRDRLLGQSYEAGGRDKVGQGLDGTLGQSRQHVGQVLPCRDIQLAVALDHAEDGCDLRTWFLAPHVQPVFATIEIFRKPQLVVERRELRPRSSMEAEIWSLLRTWFSERAGLPAVCGNELADDMIRFQTVSL